MPASLKGKRVLITGAAGFIASHIVRKLLHEDVEIHLFIRKEDARDRLEDFIDKVVLWEGDLRNYNEVKLCIEKAKPQIVFHLATLRDVRRDLTLMNSMMETNFMGTFNLLYALIEQKINLDYFINTGTCEEYGNGPVPFREDQREIPVSPYSMSKVASTYLAQMLSLVEEVPIVTIRPFLTYGPWQDVNMFVPSLIKHCFLKKDFKMTSGDQTREFNYVDDIVEAYLLVAKSQSLKGEIINIGNGIEYPVIEVAKKILGLMGNPIKLLIGNLPKRKGEATHFFCDNLKAQELLGWRPKWDLEKGLKKTIAWYEAKYSLGV